MEQLIALLGWELSTSDEKRKPFNKIFVALGVQVDYSSAAEEEIKLSNKPGRVEGIASQVQNVLEAPKKIMDFKTALSLRGKVATRK